MSVNSILCRCSLSRRARGPFTILYYNEINVNTQIHTVARRFFTSSISEIFVCRGARSSLGAVRGGCLYITPLPVYFVGRLVYDAKTPSKEDNPNEFRYCIEVNDDTRSRRTYTVYALDSHSVKACTETPRIVEMRRQTAAGLPPSCTTSRTCLARCRSQHWRPRCLRPLQRRGHPRSPSLCRVLVPAWLAGAAPRCRWRCSWQAALAPTTRWRRCSSRRGAAAWGRWRRGARREESGLRRPRRLWLQPRPHTPRRRSGAAERSGARREALLRQHSRSPPRRHSPRLRRPPRCRSPR